MTFTRLLTVLESRSSPLVSGEQVQLVEPWFFHHDNAQEDGTYEDPCAICIGNSRIYTLHSNNSYMTWLPVGTILSYREQRLYPHAQEDARSNYVKFMFYWQEKDLHIYLAINILEVDPGLSRLTTFTSIPSPS